MKKINNFTELVNIWDTSGITFIETTRNKDNRIGGLDNLLENNSEEELISKIEQGILFYKIY